MRRQGCAVPALAVLVELLGHELDHGAVDRGQGALGCAVRERQSLQRCDEAAWMTLLEVASGAKRRNSVMAAGFQRPCDWATTRTTRPPSRTLHSRSFRRNLPGNAGSRNGVEEGVQVVVEEVLHSIQLRERS